MRHTPVTRSADTGTGRISVAIGGFPGPFTRPEALIKEASSPWSGQ
jgi:hypothetical protein